MAVNTDTIDYKDDYYQGLKGFYFRKILSTIIKFGRLDEENGIILDFGCGVGHLKKTLRRGNVIGYDIEPELSEIGDYKKLKPRKIVLSGVLEHLYLDKIEALLGEFLSMNPAAELIVYLPTENWVSKIMMRLSGMPNAHDDHVSKYRDINALLDRFYVLKRRKYIFFRMAQVSLYAPRNT
jgi:SAM-dependent methyltransferase